MTPAFHCRRCSMTLVQRMFNDDISCATSLEKCIENAQIKRSQQALIMCICKRYFFKITLLIEGSERSSYLSSVLVSLWSFFSEIIRQTIMKINTEGGIMADLVLVKQIFEKSTGSDSDDKNVLFMFLLETICLTNELNLNSLSIPK